MARAGNRRIAVHISLVRQRQERLGGGEGLGIGLETEIPFPAAELAADVHMNPERYKPRVGIDGCEEGKKEKASHGNPGGRAMLVPAWVLPFITAAATDSTRPSA